MATSARANETTSLLGSLTSHTRVHYLDNLRASLAAILIVHHAILETVAQRYPVPRLEHSILSLLVITIKAVLYPTFFFLSGRSASLSIIAHSDSGFLKARTLHTTLPALFYETIGHFLLFLTLAFNWERIFGSYKANWAYIRFAGPVQYILFLTIFDLVYLFIRWLQRQSWTEHIAEYTLQFRPHYVTRHQFYYAASISVGAVATFTFAVATGHGPPLGVFGAIYLLGYEIPPPEAPVPYIVAYIGGVYFTDVKSHFFPRTAQRSWVLLFISLSSAIAAMALAQHLSDDIWTFIHIKYITESDYLFVRGGWNLHTIFYIFWMLFVSLYIPILIFAAFSSTKLTKKKWYGPWSSCTSFQTYIHMIPILVGIYRFRKVHSILLRAWMAAVGGLTGAWALVLPVMMYEALKKRLS